MKIVNNIWILGTDTGAFGVALSEVRTAINATQIVIKPIKKANGVKPIKVGVIDHLLENGWTDEHPMNLEGMRAKPLDSFKAFKNLKVGFEWETGNISSSFRALMKLIKGLVEGEIDLGIHALPSHDFYHFLTDRVGNIRELEPYINIFGLIKIPKGKGLVIIVVEHDATDKKAKLIPKGSDGMSLKRRRKLK